MLKRWLILILIGSILYLLSRCENRMEAVATEPVYLNLNDTVLYVGIESCKKCHFDKWQTFVKTGMGSSFGLADTSKSVALFNSSNRIFDPHSNYHYYPHWRGDTLFLQEYRLKNRDTTYTLNQRVDYVIGSGQHTNSHIYNLNHYLYQLPFTWYAQSGKLDLPPGYENGYNSRFNRIIGLECMSCHNAMPTGFVLGSQNKFQEVPMGIDCERCHGPGEIHVERMMAGKYVDTANGKIDYSIVNPRKLSVKLQFEICQRCHLQGNAVLAEGKSFLDFRPGMELSEVMDVYLPRYEGNDTSFIMASHVDRFKQSACFQKSEGYTCISCHNPHVSVQETNIRKFNQQCQKCHTGSAPRFECTAGQKELQSEDYNCVKCHMPSSGSVDIPHVTVHDHYVRKPGKNIDTAGIGQFIGLVSINNPDPGDRSKILAYLQQYERFNSREIYLDSALMFLRSYDEKKEKADLWMHYYFLSENYASIVDMINGNVEGVLSGLKKQSLDNRDAWTAYRIGEAYYKTGQEKRSEVFYQRAVQLAPYISDFRSKYATALLKMGKTGLAKVELGKVLNENPRHREALNNLGYYHLLEGNSGEAEYFFRQSLKWDPDYVMAWLNLANLYWQKGDQEKLKAVLDEVLRIEPGHEAAKSLMMQM